MGRARTEEKLAEASKLGAKGVLETDAGALKGLKNSFDFMLSTVPEKHKLDPFILLLKRDSTLAAVGQIGPMPAYNNMALVLHRKSLAGSTIGSIAETQEVLDFCAEHSVKPDIQLIDSRCESRFHGSRRWRCPLSLRDRHGFAQTRTSVPLSVTAIKPHRT